MIVQAVIIHTKNLKREINYEVGYDNVDELTVYEKYELVGHFCVIVRSGNHYKKMLFSNKHFVLTYTYVR